MNGLILIAWSVDLIPYFVIANIALVGFIVGIGIFLSARVLTALGVLLAVGSLAWWFVWFSQTGVRDQVVVPMTWEINPKRNPHPSVAQTHIRFAFARNPRCAVGLYSDQVAEYLRTLPSQDVNVTFAVVRDFGKVRAFHQIKIGEMRDWGAEHQYSYASACDEPSPWP